MASLKCELCGNEVSKKAENCPHCGYAVRKKGGKVILFAVLGFIVLLAIANTLLVKPEREVTQERKKPVPQQKEITQSYPSAPEWYEGGTLHNATVGRWKMAEHSNKLATASDLAASRPSIVAQVKSSGTVDSLKPFADELVVCVDKAVAGLTEIKRGKIHFSVSYLLRLIFYSHLIFSLFIVNLALGLNEQITWGTWFLSPFLLLMPPSAICARFDGSFLFNPFLSPPTNNGLASWP